jgi:hypothetical protein
MALRYKSPTVRKETIHTVSLVLPELSSGQSVPDIGCGEGYVGEELARRGAVSVEGVDVDRFVSNSRGQAYRRKIESSASFGFLSPGEWLWLFRGMGVEVESRALDRFCRSIWQPFARAAFVLRKPAARRGGGGECCRRFTARTSPKTVRAAS